MTLWELVVRALEHRMCVQAQGHQGFICGFWLHADGSARVRFEDGYEVQVPSVKETM